MVSWIISHKSQSIYHSPNIKNTDANKLIGLCLGITSLTSHWTLEPPSCLKGVKNSTFMYSPEPDFMILLVRLLSCFIK